jgi:hypothetical protein
MTKACRGCGADKPLLDFPVARHHRDGRDKHCKDCKNTRNRAYRAAHKAEMNARRAKHYRADLKCQQMRKDYERAAYPRVREKKLDQKRMRSYGISRQDFDVLLEKQGRKCAICRCAEPAARGLNWHVDHDHATGQVRGLLCRLCNLLLGHCKDSPDVLLRAVAYLRKMSDA